MVEMTWLLEYSPNIRDIAEGSDLFSSSLSAGDINGDGFDDLAIGVAGESLGSTVVGAGAAEVI